MITNQETIEILNSWKDAVLDSKTKEAFEKAIKSVEIFGKDALKQMDILQEECAELIKALSKYKRSLSHYTTVDPIDNIIEEITHVAISSEIVARLLSITQDDIKKEINKKATKFNLKKGENV